LTDSEVGSLQHFTLFDLDFVGKDSLKKVIPTKNLDSLITLLTRLDVKQVAVIYNHYSMTENQDCIKRGWEKATAIRKYCYANGLTKTRIILKAMCDKQNPQVLVSPKINNKKEFARIVILNR
jgi:hypothetical protein